jgi:Na+-driven multidrug efflux pump
MGVHGLLAVPPLMGVHGLLAVMQGQHRECAAYANPLLACAYFYFLFITLYNQQLKHLQPHVDTRAPACMCIVHLLILIFIISLSSVYYTHFRLHAAYLGLFSDQRTEDPNLGIL